MTRGNRLACAVALAALAAGATAAGASTVPAASQPAPHPTEVRGADARAEAALRQMTLKEKVALLNGDMIPLMPKSRKPAGATIGAGYIAGLPRLGVPPQVATMLMTPAPMIVP